jgi:hypothetical protein
MDDNVALAIPFVALSIPIIAILSRTALAMTKMILDARSRPSPSIPVQDYERRMAEMEQRITTLQNLVLDGEYQIRRKIEHQQAAGMPSATAPHETPPSRAVNTLSERP